MGGVGEGEVDGVRAGYNVVAWFKRCSLVGQLGRKPQLNHVAGVVGLGEPKGDGEVYFVPALVFDLVGHFPHHFSFEGGAGDSDGGSGNFVTQIFAYHVYFSDVGEGRGVVDGVDGDVEGGAGLVVI